LQETFVANLIPSVRVNLSETISLVGSEFHLAVDTSPEAQAHA
jgi:hypothetical protein